MLDTCLRSMPVRAAEEDDDLVCYCFREATIAFARFDDIQANPVALTRASFWSELKEVFFGPSPATVPIVKVPPDARLLLMDIPESLRESLDVGRIEEVTLGEAGRKNNRRDVVRFSNGSELPVSSLHAGQRVRVLSLSPEAAVHTPELTYR